MLDRLSGDHSAAIALHPKRLHWATCPPLPPPRSTSCVQSGTCRTLRPCAAHTPRWLRTLPAQRCGVASRLRKLLLTSGHSGAEPTAEVAQRPTGGAGAVCCVLVPCQPLAVPLTFSYTGDLPCPLSWAAGDTVRSGGDCCRGAGGRQPIRGAQSPSLYAPALPRLSTHGLPGAGCPSRPGQL